MIRTSLTLSISAQDAQNTSYLVNGTHLGMLSSAPQNTHVQTNNRSLQLIVAIKDEDLSSAASLVRQRQQIATWQEFLQILIRRHGSNLNNLLQQYHMSPDWLLCVDDQRLQAWISSDIGFYLLRQGDLRRLRPTIAREFLPAPDGSPSDRQYFSIRLSQQDQFFLLPPELQNYFNPGEAADMLLGLRQLPAKIGDLFNTARLRGFTEESTWLGMEIVRLEDDYLPETKSKPSFMERLPKLFGGFRQPVRKISDESGSESVGQSEDEISGEEQATQPASWLQKLMAQRWFPYSVGIGLLLLIGLIIITLISALGSGSSTNGTTKITSSSYETFQTLSPTPSQEPTNEPSPTPMPELTVSASKLNLRASPSRDAVLLKTLVLNDKLFQLEAAADGWVKVQTADGQIGYVFDMYVSGLPATTTG